MAGRRRAGLKEYNLMRWALAKVEGVDVRIDPIDTWLSAAIADAERRGLPELRPLLEGLAQSTRQLRAAEWNDYVPADGGATQRGGQEKPR
jgi:hypothetical protein